MSRRLRIISSDVILTHGLRGRVWLIGAALGVVAGIGVYLTTPPAYTATSVVELTEASPVIDLSPIAARPRLVTIDTDAQIVVSDSVISSVAAVTDQTTVQVRKSLVVTARQLTRVIQITYRAPSRETARAGAQRAADAFLEERSRLIVDPVKGYLAEVDAKTQSPDQPSAKEPGDTSQRAQSRVESWRERALAARLQVSGAGVVLESGRVRPAGDRGNLEIPLATGASVGAMLGVALSVLRRRRRATRLSRSWPVADLTPEVVPG